MITVKSKIIIVDGENQIVPDGLIPEGWRIEFKGDVFVAYKE